MRNFSYHTKNLGGTPGSGANIGEMLEYLQQKNWYIPKKPRRGSYRDILWEETKKCRIRFPEYNTEEIAKQYGIKILRLPPYHCEL